MTMFHHRCDDWCTDASISRSRELGLDSDSKSVVAGFNFLAACYVVLASQMANAGR